MIALKKINTLQFSAISFIMIFVFIISTKAINPHNNSLSALLIGEGDTIIKSKSEYLELRGNIRQQKGAIEDVITPIDSALITIYSGEIPYSELWTNKKGKCNFKLPLDKNFKIVISKNGYVTKFFDVNTKVPLDKKSTFIFGFDLDIFEEVKGLDLSVLKKAIAKVTYNITEEQFAYDVIYTSRINFDLKKMYKNYYLLQKVANDSLGKPDVPVTDKTTTTPK